MSEYEVYKKSGIVADGDNTKYTTTRFVCRACEATLYWRELVCRACDRMIEWCVVYKENGSYIVKL